MKKTTSITLSALLATGLFSGIAGAADDLTAQQKFEALKAKGIFAGLQDGSAGLDQNMNRAQFAKVAALLYGLEVNTAPPSSSFSDVPDGHWALGYIEAAKNAGLFIGYGDGTFNPSGDVTLEQLAAVLVRVLGVEVDTNVTVNGVSNWAQAYVNAALSSGFIAPQTDYGIGTTRHDLVSLAFSTDELQADLQAAQQENKASIGKLLALDVMAADGNKFGGSDRLSKDDLLKALDSMTNGKFDASSLDLPNSPTFADILRAYLQALGYPAASLQDASTLVAKAKEAGIIDKDNPYLRLQLLNVPITREFGSFLTAGTLFNASTVTVDSDGNVTVNEDKTLSQTMKLPSAPIIVNLEDIDGVPIFDSLGSIDPVIQERVTPPVIYYPPVYVDTTAPSITGATINGETVTGITYGANATIQLGFDEYLTEGTITVDEASTLTITSVGELVLGDFESLELTQNLVAGTNNFDLADWLGALDPQHNGVRGSLLSSWAQDGENLVITGTLKDSSNNSRTVTLTITVILPD